MKRVRKVLTGILAGCMAAGIIGISALADGQAVVLETYTGDAEVSVYVKGMGDDGQPGVQIATAEAERVQVQPVSQLEVPMQTTVMLDNSLSISETDRGKITEFLQDLIADRMEKEEIRIASFSEEVQMLTDYTNDYGTLKKSGGQYCISRPGDLSDRRFVRFAVGRVYSGCPGCIPQDYCDIRRGGQ